ncbi:LysE family translocator [Paracoccus onubensis]|uniref:LysE family translocator n=1 Tax=Paracoccus onubensis TaxID=1675788 RepID=UPI00273140C9|nr:LysE family translocator [Paracoccus onubensis]MDP0928360.1 LysE family translocator [Paracoccus onubensis]
MDWLIPYLPGFGAAYAIQAVSVASPGPGVALLLGIALSQGRANAVAAAFGIALGAACLALATTQGLGLLMERVAWLSTIIRIAGISYLLWLALKAFRRASQPPKVAVAAIGRPTGQIRSFVAGYLMQITNPKAIVFWLAIATVGATNNAPLPVLALFIAGAFVLSLAGHGAYAVLLSSSPFRLAYDRARRWIEAALGVFLTYVAFRLATERS